VLRDPITVQIGECEPVDTVSHCLYPVPQHLKTKMLMALLDRTQTESVLVFTRTKHRARRVGDQLKKAGYKASALQGNLSQNRRREAMGGFRDGRYQVMVATDIAARGIDIATISHVINYDMPDTATAYTHRIGRTGRATKTGDALTLVTDDDRAMIRSIERLLSTTIERRTLEGFDYSESAPKRASGANRSHRPDGRRSSRAGSSSQGAPRHTRGAASGHSSAKHRRGSRSSTANAPERPSFSGVYTPSEDRPIALTSHAGHAARPTSRTRFAKPKASRGRAAYSSGRNG